MKRFSLRDQVLMLLGLLVVLTYLFTATGVLRRGGQWLLVLVFAIGPVAIAGMLAIYQRMSAAPGGLLLKTGIVFLVIAFAFFNLMLVVQQTVGLQFRQMLGAAADDAAKESLRAIYRGVNLVQLGVDVSFDIFYCAGIILLAAAMYSHRDFGKLFGIVGMVAAALLLIFNLYTFPFVPAESGLIDLGPVTGLWWIAVILQVVRLDWRERRAAPA